jgi:4-hydroxybenzoate polyprenyltransferase
MSEDVDPAVAAPPVGRSPAHRGRLLVTGLLGACHPGPTLAVTVLGTLLAVASGAGPRTVLQLALVFLVGQLSIGWSNDWVDAARDAAVDRPDKPVARGLVDRRTVGRAALLAGLLTLPLSFSLGLRAGTAHLVAVGAGWVYNLGVKATVWSWAPYAVCFGLLPAVVTLSLPGSPAPAAWAMTAGALLGVGAHLANVLPDLEDDRRTGVRGLPHRLGRIGSTVLACVVLLLASAVVVLAPPGSPGPVGWAALGVATVLALTGTLVSLRSAGSRLPFLLTIAVAVVDVVLLLSSGASLLA